MTNDAMEQDIQDKEKLLKEMGLVAQGNARLATTIHLHVGESFAELVTHLHRRELEVEGEEFYPYIVEFNRRSLEELAKTYLALADVTIKELIAQRKNQPVQGQIPLEEESFPF